MAERSLILPMGHFGRGRRVRGVPAWRRLLPSEWAALLVLVLLCACGQAGSTPPSGSPARIVTLAPSTTEIVFGLGEGDRVVGVCAQCDYPDAATRLPRVGGYLAPSVEAVLGQRPDLVMVVPSPGNREAVRTIERAGVPVLVTADRTLDDLWGAIHSVAGALGVPERGVEMEQKVRRDLDRVRQRVAGLPTRRVLLVVGHRPLIVAGGGTLQDELVRTAGGVNVAADVGAAFPQVPLELVAARAPDVIVDAAMGTEAGGRTLFADLSSVPAVRDGRIVALSADVLFRAGPRVGEAAAALGAVIHPEAFGS